MTPKSWTEVALSNFDHFLLDHLACERKASAVGMSFVVRYPDRTALLELMIQFAREELEHFHQVYRLCMKRGLVLTHDEPDNYVNQLMAAVRNGREERLLDRLLVSSLIEGRGTERLGLVAEVLEKTDPELGGFYSRLTRAEAHHRDLFLDIAEFYFPKPVIESRWEELAWVEAEAITAVPFRAALH